MHKEFLDLLTDLLHVNVWHELLALVGAVGLAYLVSRALRKRFPGATVWLGTRTRDGVLFPLLALALSLACARVLGAYQPLAIFRIAIPALVSLAVIRVIARVLTVAFPKSVWVGFVERTVSWVAWIVVVLWVTGFLPDVLKAMEDIRWNLGKTEISLRTIMDGTLSVSVVLVLTLWLSAALEARLLKGTVGDLSGRKIAANTVRVLLLFVGFMVALTSVGINLTSLAVLGSAVGVGIGFGLQKLASNYVSGFVLLAERSVRIGDLVRVDGFQGRITDITTRYTVINDGNGREAIVPNDTLISSRVENLSMASEQMSLSTVLQVGYDSDPDEVSRLLVEAALSCPRILKSPAPTAYLSNFPSDGLEFTVTYWIADPVNGQLSARALVNTAMLKALREHGIDIPYPQRVLHMQPAPGGEGAGAAASLLVAGPP
jgi:small-conductance mechanosensitive channel